MANLIFIHSTAGNRELREIRTFQSVDIQISQADDAGLIDNTFSITVSEKEWRKAPILEDHLIYSPWTEYGGVVKAITHNTGDHTLTLQGPTWRGLLYQRMIEPPSGASHKVYDNVDALTMVRDVIGDSFGTLFTVESGTFGKLVSARFRYQSFAEGLQSTLRDYKLRLTLKYNNADNTVEVGVENVESQMGRVEISQDYGVPFTSATGNIEAANHCLALGSGELENRMVRNVYRIGNTYYGEKPAALKTEKLRTVILDYPNAESEDDLYKSAIKRLREKAPTNGISVNQGDLGESVEIGDTISIRDRLTGLAGTAEAVGKILTISGGVQKIDMQLESTGYTWNEHPEASTWGNLAEYTWREVKQSVWGDFNQ